MVFVSCSDGGGSKKEVDLTKPDTVLEGAAITLTKVGNETLQSVEGNKYTIAEGTPNADNRITNAGFGYAFTAEQKEYKYVKLEAKITAIDTDSCAAFTIKKSSQFDDLAGFGSNSSPAYSRNAELNIGDKQNDTAVASEMRKDTFVSDQLLVSLFSGGIYFQFNSYAGYWSDKDNGVTKNPMPDWMDLAIDAKLMGEQSFTLEVTKITFTNGGGADVELTADNFALGKTSQALSDGPIVDVTVTPVGGIFGADKITAIYYGADKDSATTGAPQTEGVYKVFIDVAASDGYKAASKLEVGTLTVTLEPPAYLFTLAEWMEDKVDGATFAQSGILKSDGGTKKISDGAIEFTARSEDWHGIEIDISGFDNENKIIEIVVELQAMGAGKFKLAQPNKPYSDLPGTGAKVTVTEAGTVTLTTQLPEVYEKHTSNDDPTPLPETYVRIQTEDNKNVLFKITNITIQDMGDR